MGHGFRTRLTTVALLLIVFGTGVLIGFAMDTEETTELVRAESVAEGEGDADTAASGEGTRRRRIYDQVEPNEAQLRVIDSIVVVHRERTNALDEEMRGQLSAGFRSILLETREAIKGFLSQEQAIEYQRLLDENDARRAAQENEDDRN